MALQVKAIAAKANAVGSRHIAGQHSLTLGEAICFAIAALMLLAPQVWSKMPLVGRFSSNAIALAILFVAFVIW